MRKNFRNIIYLLIVLILIVFGFAGCAYQPKKVEGDVWTYYILKDGKIALMGLNPAAIPENGVLYIPNAVDGREVTGFGIMLGKSLTGGFADPWQIPYMQKVIVAEGIPIGAFFWECSGRLVEFESRTAENIWFNPLRKNIIVPDGCRNIYIAAMEAQREGDSQRYCILEKSEVVDWHVDDDGLLKGYFGLEKDHFVFPNGIKKIDDFSFGGEASITPKTLILNDDLEEIGSYALRFSPALEEITIPKSVKYIGEFGVYAYKVYLYYSTQHHEKAFWHMSEFIYCD